MENYVCIHGHFYQPPRENPWLEAVERQDSASPYHDWNERITAECYAPNAFARIENGARQIAQIQNNYSKISFNLGPTLLNWMADARPDVYQAILDADQESRKRYSGHGSALAQVYHHVIMPLANQRDKFTQVYWGIRDFEHRFGRAPEGMWLAETAVDRQTLEILADAGILFTILSPYQARRARKLDTRAWRDASHGRIDPSMPYVVRLSKGRSIAVFFYDGPVSRAVAFEGLLTRGENLAHRLVSSLPTGRHKPALSHVATDGETYGHHHRYGDMALAYALHYIEERKLARLTNYGEFLEKFPPTYEADIFEDSAWSCSHGVGRWKEDCGCSSGSHPHWNQAWRKPLRKALDWLRGRLSGIYEKHGRALFRNAWAARNEYVDLVLDRSDAAVMEYFRRHGAAALDSAARTTALKLLEMQRHAMMMYTSCGWFFDELSGIETVQVLQYAARALELGEDVSGSRLEPGFLERLAQAPSNLPQHPDGAAVYARYVEPAKLTLEHVAGHYAVSSLFESPTYRPATYCYSVRHPDYQLLRAGKARLALGHIRVGSRSTQESLTAAFAVLHLGDLNLTGGARPLGEAGTFDTVLTELKNVFERGDFPRLFRLVDRHFGAGEPPLRLVFGDELRAIVELVLEGVLQEADTMYRRLYEHNAPLMRFITGMGTPVPLRLHLAADYTLNADLERELKASELDLPRLERLVEEGNSAGASWDAALLEAPLRRQLHRMAARLQRMPLDEGTLRALAALVRFARSLPFPVSLWEVQNACWLVRQRVYPDVKVREEGGNQKESQWVQLFWALADDLSFAPPAS
jgi:alpha-amylase/alpha-mannosidase (GH57 family)